MNLFLKTFCLSAIIVALSGCKPIKEAYNKAVYGSTVQGLVTCLELNSNSIVSEETTRNVCTKKHRVKFSSSQIDGRASVRVQKNDTFLKGTITNNFDDKIATWIEFRYSVFDENGKNQFFTADENLWLEPENSHIFSIQIEELSAEDFQKVDSCNDKEIRESCWVWNIQTVEGIIMD